MNIGLVGYGPIRTGLGFEYLRLWERLPFARWLAVRHPLLGYGLLDNVRDQWAVARTEFDPEPRAVDGFLDGLDAVVCVERAFPSSLPLLARRRGIRSVLLVNAEWFRPGRFGVEAFDYYVARTDQAFELLNGLGFGDKAARINCPMPRLSFRVRGHGQGRIVYSAGNIGVHDRKGTGVLRQAAGIDPSVVDAVYCQKPLMLFSCVQKFGEVADISQVYDDAWLALAPSRFEGVGLGILEPMAFGVPVLTTGGDPMRQYVDGALGKDLGADFLIPARRSLVVVNGQRFPAWDASPEGLIAAVNRLKGAEFQSEWPKISALVRSYIDEQHGERQWREHWALFSGHPGGCLPAGGNVVSSQYC